MHIHFGDQVRKIGQTFLAIEKDTRKGLIHIINSTDCYSFPYIKGTLMQI